MHWVTKKSLFSIRDKFFMNGYSKITLLRHNIIGQDVILTGFSFESFSKVSNIHPLLLSTMCRRQERPCRKQIRNRRVISGKAIKTMVITNQFFLFLRKEDCVTLVNLDM